MKSSVGYIVPAVDSWHACGFKDGELFKNLAQVLAFSLSIISGIVGNGFLAHSLSNC